MFCCILLCNAALSACAAPQHGSYRSVQALYLPALRVSNEQLSETLRTAARAQVNALVIDIKDADGAVPLGSAANLPLVTLHYSDHMLDVPRLMQFSKARGWYLVARIAVLLDSCVAKKRPEWIVRDESGAPVTNGAESRCGPTAFLSPYLPGPWEYTIALARKAIAAGFDEVQLDYVRFPDDPQESWHFPGKSRGDSRARSDVIAAGVARVRKALPAEVPLSVDVFGRVAEKPDELVGQSATKLAPYVDYLCPMLYPSLWSAGALHVEDPVHMPYEIIGASLHALQNQFAGLPRAPHIRPWLQTGAWPVVPYGREETQAQFKAMAELSVFDWTVWQTDGIYKPEDIRDFPIGVP
jgi:hypothetical protein